MIVEGTMIWNVVLSVGLIYVSHALRVSEARTENTKAKEKEIADRVLILETKMIEEARVREIINECVSEIKEGQVEIRSDIKGLTGEIHDLAQLMASHNING